MTKDRFAAYLDRHTLCPGGSVEAVWEPGGALRFQDGGGWRRIDPATGAIAPCPPPEPPRMLPETWPRGGYVDTMPAEEMPSPDGRWLASIRGGEIVLRNTRDGRARTITAGATADRHWDIEVSRWRALSGLQLEKVAIDPWRPDSGALFACRRDISGVFRIPRVFWHEDFEEADFTPSQKAGARIDRYQPHIVDTRRNTAIPIDIGDVEDRYVQLLGWRPDGREVLIVAYDRDMRRAEIFAADGANGAARRLMVESGETFIRLQHDTLMAGAHGFALVPGSDGFLWISSRDGWHHLYHHDGNGALIGQLTSGAWPVHDIVHVDARWAWFTASPDQDRPYDVHLCRVPLAGGAVQRLSEAPGIHRPRFAPDGSGYIDAHSAVDRPLVTELRRADGTFVATLAAMDIAGLEAVGFRAPEEFTVIAADSETELWGVMYKPADFDPVRRYPLIEYIYGGPQLAVAAHHFPVFPARARNLAWALAQLGFIVVCLDGRGTPGRSKAFQDATYGRWGQHEMDDHAAGIRQLCDRHPFIDRDRVGIIGHSWGGYYSSAGLIQHPALYKVAVSSSPGYIPRESILYEPYLGLYRDNPEGYRKGDLTQSAAMLRGALLLVAGTSETGPFGDAMKMSRALIEAGIQHEFAVLPGQFHSYAGAGEAYFIAKAAAFLTLHLKPEGSPR